MKNLKSTVLVILGLATVFVMAMILSGCAKGIGGQANSDNVIKVAVCAPLTGPQAPFGEQCKMGAEMAVEEKKVDIEKLGFKVEFIPQDDSADPKMGVSVAQKLVTDPDVLGVIGHMNSGVCIPAEAIYAKANLAMYTSFATNTKVTELGYTNVGRICGRDDIQGQAAATFAKEDLKAASSFIIQDKSAYGQGIADEYKKKAEAIGIKTLGYEGITQGEVDFSAVINKVIQANPDVVYYGGNYTEAGLILKGMRGKGSKAIFIGCDGEESEEFVKIAGPAVIGAYYTSMTPSLSESQMGQDFTARVQAKYQKQPEAMSVYSYDAGLVVMQGILDSIKANGNKKPTREQVSATIRKSVVQGLTGTISFDDKGDNKDAKSFIMQFNEQKYPGVLVKKVTKQ